jgi:HD-like signal output (HDOD) protein
MKRILIVDDEFLPLDGLRRALACERSRWEVHTALNAEAALAEAARTPIDLVLADFAMPGTDGIAFLREMREQHPACMRLLLAGPAEMHLAIRASAIAYRVLPKAADAAVLLRTVERIFALQDRFASPQLRAILGRIGELPSLSSAYTALNLAVRNPEISVAEVASIVDRDVAMSGKVLQLVNSGFFALAQTMTSVQSAVSYLGMETIKNLALASETFRLFVPDPCMPRDFLESLHAHAYRTASIVCSLPLNLRERETAVIAALLQDIGELILASRMPELFAAAMRFAVERKCPRHIAEDGLIGVSHAELGAYLLGVWGIGGLVVEAVAHHHEPTRIHHEGFDGSAAVYVASVLARQLDLHPEDTEGAHLEPADKEALAALGLMHQYPLFRVRAIAALKRA